MMTRGRRRRRRAARMAFVRVGVFSNESRALLRNLLSFASPRGLAALEATAGLFGREYAAGGEASLVELAARDALAGMGRPGLAEQRRAGEAWAYLLVFAVSAAEAEARRGTISAGGRHSLVVRDGALWSFGDGRHGPLGHGDVENQLRSMQVPF